MVEALFIEISSIIILAVIVSGIMRMLRQPLIIGYIITGVVAGPFLFNALQSTETISALSHFGIVFLLFVAGLSLNPRMLKSVGKVSILSGLGQIIITTIIGFFIAKFFGFSDIAALYIGIALTFSSTVIIIKLLSDRGNLESLYGKILLGFLLMQDIVAVFVLIIVSSTNSVVVGISITDILFGIAVLGAIIFFSYFALMDVVKRAARSSEFLFLFSIGWLLLISIVFGYLKLSVEIGALLAGISLSMSQHNYEIRMKMNVLRDFFILFFFILLGSQLMLTDVTTYIVPIIVLSVFVLVGNPLIMMAIMGSLKYTKRTSFLAGVSIAQISEFSLIIVALGVALGQINNSILSVVTAIGLITIFGSTYMITHANTMYNKLSRYLGIFERKGRKVDIYKNTKTRQHKIILFGYNRIGFTLLESIKKLKPLVVDYNPEIIKKLRKNGITCRYGDINDEELLSELNLKEVKMIISTIPDIEANQLIINKSKEANKNVIIIAVAHQIDDAIKLYENGASYVLMPYFLGGKHAGEIIKENKFNVKKFMKERTKHINRLKLRKKMQHEHPKPEKDR